MRRSFTVECAGAIKAPPVPARRLRPSLVDDRALKTLQERAFFKRERRRQSSLAASQGDGVLKSSISYRCMKVRDGIDYYHLASAVDVRAIKTLQERDFFKRYTERTKLVAGGEVEVLPLEVVAETLGPQ